jgi:hypothetical protein
MRTLILPPLPNPLPEGEGVKVDAVFYPVSLLDFSRQAL